MNDDTDNDDGTEVIEAVTSEQSESLKATPYVRTLPPAMAAKKWQPGQSGNPGGKGGKYKEILALARAASPEAMKRIIELTQSDDERVAFTASKEVLERAYGKVKEAPANEPEERTTPDLSALTPMQLAALKDAMQAVRISREAAKAGVTIIEADAE